LIHFFKRIIMTSLQQVQSVAKRLEKMLETALNQLKIEQQLRKKSDQKLIDLELELVNKEHRIKSLEEQISNVESEKDEKIENLESTINFLQSVIIQKEKEVLCMQEKMGDLYPETNNSDHWNFNRSVEKFEETLSELIGKSNTSTNEKDVSVTDDGLNSNNEYLQDGEEYVLDETIEELEDNYKNNVEEKPNIKRENNLKQKSKKVKKSKLKCSCKEKFDSEVLLREHQNTSGHTPKFQCDVCQKHFKTKSIMQIHKTRIHSDAMPYKCGKCEKRFKDQGSCRRHEANDSVHIRMENMKLNPNLLCNVCGKEFDRNRRWCLDQHLLTHLANKKFSCDNCGNFYRQKSYLQTHMKTCMANIKVEAETDCKVCNIHFSSKVELEEHENREHTIHDKGALSCKICSVSFGSFKSYFDHGKKAHNATSAKHFESIQEIISSNT